MVIITGDWNAQTGIGDIATCHIIGDSSLSHCGKNGDRLICLFDLDWLCLTNTCSNTLGCTFYMVFQRW